jgi:hypothetical protein
MSISSSRSNYLKQLGSTSVLDSNHAKPSYAELTSFPSSLRSRRSKQRSLIRNATARDKKYYKDDPILEPDISEINIDLEGPEFIHKVSKPESRFDTTSGKRVKVFARPYGNRISNSIQKEPSKMNGGKKIKTRRRKSHKIKNTLSRMFRFNIFN